MGNDMNAKSASAVFLLFLSPFLWAEAEHEGDFIRLVAALDEPEFYCLDLAGWGAHLQLDDPLQTHTCKMRGGDDQMFHFADGHLKASLFDRCVQAAGSSGKTLAGSAIIVRPCSDNALQMLELDAEGRLRVGETNFCIAAGKDSTEASGPSHMWRTLIVADCDDAEESLATWQVGLD
jgi:hypothetical protein